MTTVTTTLPDDVAMQIEAKYAGGSNGAVDEKRAYRRWFDDRRIQRNHAIPARPDFSFLSYCRRRLGYARIGPAGSLFVLPPLEGARVSVHLDALATQIATLDPAEQEALWEKVAELNFQRGLEALAQKYRARLAAEGTLDQTADTVMAKLKKLREEIAADDYRT